MLITITDTVIGAMPPASRSAPKGGSRTSVVRREIGATRVPDTLAATARPRRARCARIAEALRFDAATIAA